MATTTIYPTGDPTFSASGLANAASDGYATADYETLAAAIAAASDGDTIVLKAEDEYGVLTPWVLGEPSDFDSEANHTRSYQKRSSIVLDDAYKSLTLRGEDVLGKKTKLVCTNFEIDLKDGPKLGNATLRDLHFNNSPGYAIFTKNYGTLTVEDCIFDDPYPLQLSPRNGSLNPINGAAIRCDGYGGSDTIEELLSNTQNVTVIRRNVIDMTLSPERIKTLQGMFAYSIAPFFILAGIAVLGSNGESVEIADNVGINLTLHGFGVNNLLSKVSPPTGEIKFLRNTISSSNDEAYDAVIELIGQGYGGSLAAAAQDGVTTIPFRVEGNFLTVRSDGSHGIRLEAIENSTIKGNTIYMGRSSKDYSGTDDVFCAIGVRSLAESRDVTGNTIEGNFVEGMGHFGIALDSFVDDDTAGAITGNTVRNNDLRMFEPFLARYQFGKKCSNNTFSTQYPVDYKGTVDAAPTKTIKNDILLPGGGDRRLRIESFWSSFLNPF